MTQLKGLAQVNIPVDDVVAARDWYADFLGVEPYFQRPDEDAPAYVEFRVGDRQDELGIIDKSYVPTGSTSVGGAIVRWHVEDVPETHARLLGLGAKVYEPIVEREDGFVTSSVLDPFGNILGLIHSPHYVEHSRPVEERSAK